MSVILPQYGHSDNDVGRRRDVEIVPPHPCAHRRGHDRRRRRMAGAGPELFGPNPIHRRTRDAALISERVPAVGRDPQRRATTPNASPSAFRCSRCATATAGRASSATGCRHRGMALVEGPGCSHALVCRYHGWTYRLDGYAFARPARRGLPRPGHGRRADWSRSTTARSTALIVIGPLRPPAPQQRSDAAMAALADGSPWRDKLLPAGRLLHRETGAARDELEGSRRAVPGGLPHPLDAQGHLLSDPVRRPQRRRNRSARTRRITFPYQNIERLRDRPEADLERRPPGDLRVPPVPERHGRDVPQSKCW